MQITAASPIPAALSYGKQDAQPQAGKAVEPHKMLTPAPGLRPNVQDFIDINRTLIALRRL